MDTQLTLLTGFGCGPCDKVKERLNRLKAEFPALKVDEVDIGSREGADLAIRCRLGALPAIFVNGRVALVGDVSEGLLRERLFQATQVRQGQN